MILLYSTHLFVFRVLRMMGYGIGTDAVAVCKARGLYETGFIIGFLRELFVLSMTVNQVLFTLTRSSNL